jgi:DNA-binding MarR family transcriptional regulator
MEPGGALARGRRVDEITEALPIRAAALTRLFLSRTTVRISRTELGVLSELSVRSRRITELAVHEGITQPAMTLLVDRLERRRWVERTADPLDGRAVLVRLTRTGMDVLDEVRAEYRALLHEDVATLSDEDVDALGRAVEILEELIGSLREREA